jgi:hypothetical protein
MGSGQSSQVNISAKSKDGNTDNSTDKYNEDNKRDSVKDASDIENARQISLEVNEIYVKKHEEKHVENHNRKVKFSNETHNTPEIVKKSNANCKDIKNTKNKPSVTSTTTTTTASAATSTAAYELRKSGKEFKRKHVPLQSIPVHSQNDRPHTMYSENIHLEQTPSFDANTRDSLISIVTSGSLDTDTVTIESMSSSPPGVSNHSTKPRYQLKREKNAFKKQQTGPRGPRNPSELFSNKEAKKFNDRQCLDILRNIREDELSFFSFDGLVTKAKVLSIVDPNTCTLAFVITQTDRGNASSLSNIQKITCRLYGIDTDVKRNRSPESKRKCLESQKTLAKYVTNMNSDDLKLNQLNHLNHNTESSSTLSASTNTRLLIVRFGKEDKNGKTQCVLFSDLNKAPTYYTKFNNSVNYMFAKEDEYTRLVDSS